MLGMSCLSGRDSEYRYRLFGGAKKIKICMYRQKSPSNLLGDFCFDFAPSKRSLLVQKKREEKMSTGRVPFGLSMLLFGIVSVLLLQDATAENVSNFFLRVIPSTAEIERAAGIIYVTWFFLIIGRGVLGFSNHHRDFHKQPRRRLRMVTR